MSTKITRNKSQYFGTLGESIVQLIVDKNENWISRKLSNDFGIDFELELCNPDISGQFIKVQVKSSEKLNEKSKLIIARVSKKLLNYSFDCRLPVIIVFVDVSQNKAYYCWLQEWLERYFPNGEFKSYNKSTFKIEIPISHTLEVGLEKILIPIAKGMTNTQLLFNIREAIRISLQENNSSIIERLTNILIDISSEYKLFTFDTIIEEVINLGDKVWRSKEGGNKSFILYGLCREYGGKITTDHIDKIVIRNNTLSRVGLSALGILYTEHFNHMKSLKLPIHYKKTSDLSLEYYCSLREKYPELSDLQLTNENLDRTIEGIDVDIIKKDIFDKYMNRGTSALFDYMYSPSSDERSV